MTAEDKIKKYEALLHDIQLNAEVVMNQERVKKLISNICKWSYAHRVGNGELTELEQEATIQRAFDNLLK